MKNFFLIILLSALASCQTLMGALGGGVGGGVGAAVAGPPGAAIGAVTGVIAMESMVGGSSTTTAIAGATGQPQGEVASTLNEAGGFIQTVGWWYVALFVLVPLLTKKGRTWFKKFGSMHNAVSQEDIDVLAKNTVSKKDVDDHSERLHRMEGIISSLQNKDKS